MKCPLMKWSGFTYIVAFLIWGLRASSYRVKFINMVLAMLDLQDPDPLVRGMDPASDPDPSLFS